MSMLDEDWSVVIYLYAQAALRAMYRNPSLLFSVAGWAEPEQGMKRFSSVQ